ncbi:MAG: hypothetical protein JO247_13930, partial [Chloroflexi bacterium]|nr:hypothetical protein [Chloroflexota bacterium]
MSAIGVREPSPAETRLGFIRTTRRLGVPTSVRSFGLWLFARIDLLTLMPLAMFAIAPLVRAPFFASADGLFHLYRLVEFDRDFRAGQLYPRWAPDLLGGYGYPIFIFYAPLLYYLGEAFHLAGLGFAEALKATIAAGMLASSLGMYVFGRHLWGRLGGFISAIAFLYAPYRLVNTYLDGELAQTLAWAWLPWLFWACWRWLETRRARWGLVAALCYAGLICTHSVASWLATMFLGLVLLGLLALRRARVVDELSLAGFLALGAALAAPYWLPALAEQANVQLDRVRIATYDFHTNLLPLARTLSASLAHQYTGYTGVNGPAQLGLIQTAVGLLGLAAAIVFARRHALAGLFGVLALVFFVLMLPPAARVWEVVPFGRYLQFPDRLLTILAFCLAVLAGGLAVAIQRIPFRWARPLAAAIVAGAIVYGATGHLAPSYLDLPSTLTAADVATYEQLSGATGTTAKGEFTPRWFSASLTRSPNQLPVPTAPTLAAGPAGLPLAYFPGWTATVNGQQAPVTPGPDGLVRVEAPAGSQIQLAFGQTPDRQLADVIAVVGAFMLASLAFLLGRHTHPTMAATRLTGSIAAEPQSPPMRGVAKRASARLTGGIAASETASRPMQRVGEDASARRETAVGPGTLRSNRLSRVVAIGGGAALLTFALAVWPGKLALAGWAAARPMDVTYADGISLVGSDVHVTDTDVHVSVALQAGRRIQGGTQTALRLMFHDQVWASASQPLATQGWRSGQIRRAEFDLPLAGGTPAGSYSLELDMLHADGTLVEHDLPVLAYDLPPVRLPPLGASYLGPITLTTPANGGVPGQLPVDGDIGPMQLRFWAPPARTEQGQFLPFDTWWSARDAPAANWLLSLKVVDTGGRVWAGSDAQPRDGWDPTSQWAAGELHRDVSMLQLPEGIPTGQYRLVASWLDAATHASVGRQNVTAGTFDVVPASKPDAGRLNIPHPLQKTFPEGLTLLGYDVPSAPVTAGQPVPIRLFWRTDHTPDADYSVQLDLGGQSTTPVPLPASSHWRVGQLVETPIDLPTSPGDALTALISVTLGSATAELPMPVTIQAPPRLTKLPSGLTHSTPDTLANTVRLAGYRLAPTAGSLQLTLYWQPLASLPPNELVFVHLLDSQNHVVAQHDGIPAAGPRP